MNDTVRLGLTYVRQDVFTSYLDIITMTLELASLGRADYVCFGGLRLATLNYTVVQN